MSEYREEKVIAELENLKKHIEERIMELEKAVKMRREMDSKPASPKQKKYIRDLSKKLNIKIPENLDEMSREEASKYIDELLKKKKNG